VAAALDAGLLGGQAAALHGLLLPQLVALLSQDLHLLHQRLVVAHLQAQQA
jgi:hypothetical protein